MFSSMSRPSFRRYHPSTFTPQEAFARATEPPRAVRQLGEAVVAWSLSNVVRDVRSPLGNLPESFGFRSTRLAGDLEAPLAISLSRHTKLFVTSSVLWCTSDDGSTVLSASAFEPARLLGAVEGDRWHESARVAKRPTTNVAWVLGWNHASAALEKLSEYELWVQRRGAGLRSASERPKAARKTEVSTVNLPEALRALAEWASDAERAMLAWIIAEAKSRDVKPELPARYRQDPLDRLVGWLRR